MAVIKERTVNVADMAALPGERVGRGSVWKQLSGHLQHPPSHGLYMGREVSDANQQ